MASRCWSQEEQSHFLALERRRGPIDILEIHLRSKTMASFHFVLVPGAFHQPEANDKLCNALSKLGDSAVVSSLPSCDAQDPQISADAEVMRMQILQSRDTVDKDVVVVAHSYGGIPAGGAAHGLGKIARAEEGKRCGVIGLLYVCGFIVPEKSSLEWKQ